MCPGHPQVLNFIFLSFSRHKPECCVLCGGAGIAGEARGLRPVWYGRFHPSLSPDQCVLEEPRGHFPPFKKEFRSNSAVASAKSKQVISVMLGHHWAFSPELLGVCWGQNHPCVGRFLMFFWENLADT